MKFMVNWSVDQDNWIPVLRQWTSLTPEQRTDAGEGVKILGRWHDLAGRTGVVILEASDVAAVTRYLGHWNAHMELEVTPVLDDEESVEVGKAMIEIHGG